MSIISNLLRERPNGLPLHVCKFKSYPLILEKTPKKDELVATDPWRWISAATPSNAFISFKPAKRESTRYALNALRATRGLIISPSNKVRIRSEARGLLFTPLPDELASIRTPQRHTRIFPKEPLLTTDLADLHGSFFAVIR